MAKIIITIPSSGGVTNHNNLLGLQGGSISLNQFYHLTLEERDGLINLIDNPVTPLDFDNGLRLDINTVNLGINPDEEFLNGTPGLLTRPTGLIFGNISTDVSFDYTGLQISGDNLSRTSSLLSKTFTEGYDLYSGFAVTNVVNNGGTGTSNFVTYFDDIEGTKEMSFNISHNASGPGYINKLEIRDDSNLTGITTFGDYSDNQILEDNAYITKLAGDKLIALANVNNILQNGNTFGAAPIIGSNDNFNVIFKRNNINTISVTSFGLQFNQSARQSIANSAGTAEINFSSLNGGFLVFGQPSGTSPVMRATKTGPATNNDLLQLGDTTVDNRFGVRSDGRAYASNATVSNDLVTLGQLSLGLPGGIATLDGNGKVPLSQINDALIGNVNFKGLYNGTIITSSPDPALVGQPLPTAATGNKGWYFIATTTFTNGGNNYTTGDWIISNATQWDKVDNTDAVSSVNGMTGVISLGVSDIIGLTTALNLKANDADVIHKTGVEGPITGQKNFTNNTSSSSLSFTNSSIGNSIGINNTGSTGLSISNSTGGTTGLFIANTSTTSGSAAINILNTQNNAINMSVQSASTAMFTMLQDTARGIVMYGNSTGDKIYFLSPSSTDAFKVDAIGNTTANSFVKIGGTASQFLKADGSVDSIAYAPINNPTFTGTVTIPSAGLTLSGGSVNNVIQGNGVPTNTATLVRNIIISTNNGVSTTIVANSTNFNNAVWQLQNQVNNRIALASDNAVAGLLKVAYMTEAQYLALTPNADTSYFIEEVVPTKIVNIVTNAATYGLVNISKVMYITLTGTTSTITLPVVTGGTGVKIIITNQGTGNATLNSNTGSNDIWNGGVATNTDTIGNGETYAYYNNGLNYTKLNA